MITLPARAQPDKERQQNSHEHLLRAGRGAKVGDAAAQLPERALGPQLEHEARRKLDDYTTEGLGRGEKGRERQAGPDGRRGDGALLQHKAHALGDDGLGRKTAARLSAQTEQRSGHKRKKTAEREISSASPIAMEHRCLP